MMPYGELPQQVRAALAQYHTLNISEFVQEEFPDYSYQEINYVIQRLAQLGELQRVSRGTYRVINLFARSYKKVKRKGQVPQDTLDVACKLYAAGWSQREISKKLGISRSTIRAAVVRTGQRIRARNEQRYSSPKRNLKLPKQLVLDI